MNVGIPSPGGFVPSNIGGNMPLPAIVLASLIGAGGSLLGGVLSGIGKGAQEKQAMRFQEEMQERTWEEENRRREEKKQELTGGRPRFGVERNLPWWNYELGKMLQGYMGDVLGEERLGRYGINIGDIQKGAGFGDPFSQSYMGGGYANQPSPYGYFDKSRMKVGAGEFPGPHTRTGSARESIGSGTVEAEPDYGAREKRGPARDRLMSRYGY